MLKSILYASLKALFLSVWVLLLRPILQPSLNDYFGNEFLGNFVGFFTLFLSAIIVTEILWWRRMRTNG